MKVLNDGYLEIKELWGSDEAIVESARMSTDKGFLGWGTTENPGDEKLLKYLWNNQHTSPFEQAGMRIEVQAPIMVFREWHRHRTMCLDGNTKIIFNRPCDNKAYPMLLKDIYKKWNPPEPKRQRPYRTLKEFNRYKLNSMLLRSSVGDVALEDIWYSEPKVVYNVKTKYGSVQASANHIFKTPEGESNINNGLKTVMAMIAVGNKNPNYEPVFTEQELNKEVWKEIDDGYEVSSLGRVKSYLGLGIKYKKNKSFIKKPVINSVGRAVVSLRNKPYQVSHLVCKAFIGEPKNLQVLHKNDNPLDNRAENLYIGTPQDNINDQYVNGGMKKLRECPVDVIDIKKIGVVDTYDISVSGNHWFVADNLLVHNSYNELSARYTVMPNLHYSPTLERIKESSLTNKQAQGINPLTEDKELQNWIIEMECLQSSIYNHYEKGLKLGIPKEVARLNTPVSRYSKMQASANLLNWLKFLKLRTANNAQWEIRQYALALENLMTPYFPRTMEIIFNRER